MAFRHGAPEESRRAHAVPTGAAERRPPPPGTAEDRQDFRLRAARGHDRVGEASIASGSRAAKPCAGPLEQWPEHGVPLAPREPGTMSSVALVRPVGSAARRRAGAQAGEVHRESDPEV